jgi:aryl-alcohol dehydrogenase-like predicted oxidoreductase
LRRFLGTLDDLVRAGKIRYVGCSNFSGWHLMKSLAVSERYGLARYVAHQAYYSLVGRDYEWELMPLALDQRVGTVVDRAPGRAELASPTAERGDRSQGANGCAGKARSIIRSWNSGRSRSGSRVDSVR